ncbi:hypothetical protein SGLAD_v1c03740 [Spiroplasma gladiatoris]|uniref:Uncharacterized protein n=1 Tax=Spiroplasma gladiatoris TaxID=2143 RepID=A0A4P7AIM5_9MOLU|nr:hypothetical protein [Spiroplasma gladiatoris]QBQ07573.1 hypothetical protein SGLAD_v1c03740 [Spiroplasma gladiatoris]
MLSTYKIKQDLAKTGYNWFPNYKDILEKVWANMESYFDDDEEVQSALWASFKRYEDKNIGIVFITSKRTFTIETADSDANTQVRYLPIDSYSLQKIQMQLAKSGGLNYVSLQNDSFGNGITFACPNPDVVKHFVETLRGRSNAEIEILPESDEPLLANNEIKQVIDKDLNKAKENKPHKFEEKHEDKAPMKEHDLWRKAPPENIQKEVVIKVVPPKKVKPDKKKITGYASKWKSKLWLLWFLLPIGLIAIVLSIMFLV